MANCITKHIPNAVTCLNLFSGCIACVMAFEGEYEIATILIILSAVFDFFDGMLARLLKAYSAIGKELDSLADCVSFGVAPSILLFSLMKEIPYAGSWATLAHIWPYSAFFIAVLSALRLAKFNVDERQTSSFIGLPTPANALFWASLVLGSRELFISPAFNPLYLLIIIGLSSYMLISEIPMFSLKFKNLSWSANRTSFIFLIGCAPLLILFKMSGFAAIVVWYILLSIGIAVTNRGESNQKTTL